MKGSKFLLAAIAAKLVEAYKMQIAEYQTVYPLALGVADDAPCTYEALKAEESATRVWIVDILACRCIILPIAQS